MERLTLEERQLLTRMLTSHAYRERLAFDRFSTAVSLAPSPSARSHVVQVTHEELMHFRGCLEVASEIGLSIESAVDMRMTVEPAGIPAFGSWLDAMMAHAFNDRAGYHVLLGIRHSKVTLYARLAESILEEEMEHGSYGAAAFVDLYRDAGIPEAEKRSMLLTHLEAAIRCMGRPNSPGDLLAVQSGLKTRSSAETLVEFSRYVDPILLKVGRDDLVPLSRRQCS